MKVYKHSLGLCFQFGNPTWKVQIIFGVIRRYSYGETWYTPLAIRVRG